jgi:ABC-2 type transport system permease protein
MLSTLCVFFRDIQHLYTVITTAWLYLTPVFYDIKMLGDGWISWVAKLNPLTSYITYFRDVVIYGTLPTAALNYFCFGYAILFFVAGFLFFRAKQDRFILHI